MDLQREKVFFMNIIIVILLFGIAACQTPAGRTAGTVVDDATISTMVKSKLFKDKQLSGFAISVSTFKGVVTLTGAVESGKQRKLATSIAFSVMGAKSVNNLLKIK